MECKFKINDFVTYYTDRQFSKGDPSKDLGIVVEIKYSRNLKIILYRVRWIYNESVSSEEINYYQQHQIILI